MMLREKEKKWNFKTVNSEQLTITNYQLPITNYQLPITNYQLPITHYQLPMSDDKVYLKPNAIVEPLINQWYAWSYLVPPATAARYIANSHIKIMESFIEAPQVHQSALKNPAMMGGPFINYDASRVDEVKDLLEKTKSEQANLIRLAAAIQELDKILREKADGYSLEALYEKVPEELKGYVELVYDANNHPSIRFIEGLLYRCSDYQSASQTVALSLADEDTRSFVLSTPRLPDNQTLHLNFRFNNPCLLYTSPSPRD